MPIACGDVAVFPGDIIVGDDDSVTVIPDEIADKAVEMTAYEDFVVEGGESGPHDYRALPHNRGGQPVDICRMAKEIRTMNVNLALPVMTDHTPERLDPRSDIKG